jgi:CBS domain-containing protein
MGPDSNQLSGDYGHRWMRTLDPEQSGVGRPVLWTRGSGCRDLAELLSSIEPVRVVGNVAEACVRHRAELVVSRRASSNSQLVSTVAPVDFDPSQVGSVIATVAGGPHSELAAMAAAYRTEDEKGRAVATIETLYQRVSNLEYRLVQADDAEGLASRLPDDALIVLGAAGGGWLQRSFLGPGVRLRQKAPAGAVVVRREPDRVFQVMGDPVFVGPLREAVDILRVHHESVLAVVDRAVLVGVVRREALELAEPGVPVQDLMESPESVSLMATVAEAQTTTARFGGGTVPVTDDEGRLVGSLSLDG